MSHLIMSFTKGSQVEENRALAPTERLRYKKEKTFSYNEGSHEQDLRMQGHNLAQ